MSTRQKIKVLLGQRPGVMALVETDALEPDWSFKKSRIDLVSLIARQRLKRRRAAPPPSATLKKPEPASRWVLYFIYAPDGRLTDAHRFSLNKLRTNGIRLAVICATENIDGIPSELHDCTDALYWKGLSGFDFSAFSIGLGELAAHSPGADILVLNDSMFGPFTPVEKLFEQLRWDLTGFTASGAIENHIQSYAFMLRDWTEQKVKLLSPIMSRERAFNDYIEVVFCQESAFARVASQNMSVGALWYADHIRCSDASVFAALSLLDAGFPFLKKSLLTKHARFNDVALVRAALQARDHPC